MLYPIYFIGILILIKVFNTGTEKPRISDFPEYHITNSGFTSNFKNFTGKAILISPDSLYYQSLANDTLTAFRDIIGITGNGGPSLLYFADKTAMDNHYLSNSDSIAAGIIFGYSGGNNFSYALRLPSTSIPGTNSWTSTSGMYSFCVFSIIERV